MSRTFGPGDPVIYHKTKYSTSPGPRAREVTPTPHGEDYAYVVDKFWLVKESRDDGTVVLITRRGKEHQVRKDSPNFRHARWWERLLYSGRFPELRQIESPALNDQPAGLSAT
jgi:hypothetical protein